MLAWAGPILTLFVHLFLFFLHDRLFAIEGAATVIVGIISFFFLPDRPINNKKLSERQLQLAVTRLIKDDPHKADKPGTIVPLKEVWAAVSDWNVWPNLIFAFIIQITTAGYGLYLPLIIQSFGFSALNSNLLTVPNQIFALIVGVSSGFISDRFKIRWQVILFGMSGLLLGYILNIAVPASTSRAGAYVASIITVGFFLPWHSVNASWQAANVAPAGKRAIIFSMYIIRWVAFWGREVGIRFEQPSDICLVSSVAPRLAFQCQHRRCPRCLALPRRRQASLPSCVGSLGRSRRRRHHHLARSCGPTQVLQQDPRGKVEQAFAGGEGHLCED